MESIFKKYHSRFVRIAILKSICFSAIFGFGVNFLTALILLFFDLSVAVVLGISIGAGVLAFGCAALLLYRFKFRPTLNRMASALDEQGLEERTATMVEFENDDSFVVKAQREDAVKKLATVNPKSLRFVLPTIAVVLISLAMVLGISMTTVTALSAADVIQLPGEESEQENPEESDEPDEDEEDDMVSVLYEAGEHGSISGNTYQVLTKGGNATAVVAVPEEGYVFTFWSDGKFTAERQDINVMSSFSVTAFFAKEMAVGPGEEGGGEEGGEAGGQQGGQQGGSAGSGQHGEGEGDGNGEDGEGEGGGGASGSTAQDNNTVIDGKTDYHNEIDYDAAKEAILKDDTLSQEEKDMFLRYLDILMEDSKNNQ